MALPRASLMLLLLDLLFGAGTAEQRLLSKEEFESLSKTGSSLARRRSINVI